MYAIDILCTSGEAKATPRETRTTVFKKTDATYQLKLKTSRAVYSEIAQKFTTMPFSLRCVRVCSWASSVRSWTLTTEWSMLRSSPARHARTLLSW